MENGHFGTKFKKCEKGDKNDSTSTLEWFCTKNRVKKHLIGKKREHFENGQNWAKAHAKWSVWVKNEKCEKGAKIDSTTTLEWLCEKHRVKKHLIVKKREAFENGQNWPKAWVIAHAKWSVWVKI